MLRAPHRGGRGALMGTSLDRAIAQTGPIARWLGTTRPRIWRLLDDRLSLRLVPAKRCSGTRTRWRSAVVGPGVLCRCNTRRVS